MSEPTASPSADQVSGEKANRLREFDHGLRHACQDEHLRLLIEHRSGLGDREQGGLGNRVTLGIVPEGTPGVPTNTAWWFYDRDKHEGRVCVGEGIVSHLTKNAVVAERYGEAYVRHEMAHDRWTTRDLKTCFEASEKAGVASSTLNLWEDARIEHLARHEKWGPFHWKKFESPPAVSPQRPHSLIFAQIWSDDSPYETRLLAQQGKCSDEQIAFAGGYYRRAVQTASTEALIPLILEFQQEWEQRWPSPTPPAPGEGRSGNPSSAGSGSGGSSPDSSKGSGSGGSSPDSSKGSSQGSGKEGSCTPPEPQADASADGEPKGDQGSKNPSKGKRKGKKAGESAPSGSGDGDGAGHTKPHPAGNPTPSEAQPGKAAGGPPSASPASGDEGRGGTDWSAKPRSEDMQAFLTLTSNKEARQALLDAIRSGDKASMMQGGEKGGGGEGKMGGGPRDILGNGGMVTILDASNAYLVERDLMATRPDRHPQFDRQTVDEMTNYLRSAFRGQMRNAHREAPSKRLDCKAIMQGREDVWRVKVPDGFQGRRRVVVYLDGSGSMDLNEESGHYPHWAGKELISALGNLQRAGVIEGHVVAHKMIGCHRIDDKVVGTAKFHTMTLPIPEDDLRAIIPNGGSEGILPAMRGTAKIASEADVVLVVSDGNICDDPPKGEYAKMGITPIGFYVGPNAAAGDLPNHVDRTVISPYKREAVMTLAQIIANTPTRRRR